MRAEPPHTARAKMDASQSQIRETPRPRRIVVDSGVSLLLFTATPPPPPNSPPSPPSAFPCSPFQLPSPGFVSSAAASPAPHAAGNMTPSPLRAHPLCIPCAGFHEAGHLAVALRCHQASH